MTEFLTAKELPNWCFIMVVIALYAQSYIAKLLYAACLELRDAYRESYCGD